MAATRQTVRAAAGAEQPAVAARWWVVVPYRPVIDDSREQLRAGWARCSRTDVVGDPSGGCVRERAARRPGRGGPTRRWDRHVAAGRHPGARAAVGAPSPRRRAHRSRAGAAARAACRHVRGCGGDQARGRLERATGRSRRSASGAERGIDTGEHPAWLRHADGTLEETIHLASPAAGRPTRLGCRTCSAARCPRRSPCTSAVGGRSRERHASAGGGSGCGPRSATRSGATGSSATTSRTRWRRPQ